MPSLASQSSRFASTRKEQQGPWRKDDGKGLTLVQKACFGLRPESGTAESPRLDPGQAHNAMS